MTSRRSIAASAAVLIATLILAGCGSAASTASTYASTTPAAASPTPVLTPVPGGSTPASPPPFSPPTQTLTEWGRIWDGLPSSFPAYPDAVPTETGEGPASASLAVGDAAENVAERVQTSMTGAGFSFESVEGPSEDGSFTLNAVGHDPGCVVQVRIRPLSGTTNIVVMYGAGCPFD